MKTLIFGAGPLESLYTYLFHKSGIDLTILARNDQYNFLVNNGIILVNEFSGEELNERVKVVNNFGEDDFYDLVVVLMRKNNVKKILKKLSADQETLKKYIKAVKESGKVSKELGYRNKFPVKIKSF